MKRFLFTTEVLNAEGYQVWRVDAEDKNEALAKFNAGDGEIYAEEVEVVSVGEPTMTGETKLDDFGDFK